MTEQNKVRNKKHISLIPFMLIWLIIAPVILFLSMVGSDGLFAFPLTLMLWPYIFPSILIGLLLYLIYWFIWGKKQKEKWEESKARIVEKAHLYDEHIAGKEDQ